ncbi:MAG: septum formation initiator family protein [Bacteroidaceae bacterium]
MIDNNKETSDSNQEKYDQVVNSKKRNFHRFRLWLWRHRYKLIIIYFAITIGFTSNNTLVDLFHNYVEINRIETNIQENKDKLNEINKQIELLKHDPDALEQIARERYLMKRENEDIFQFKEDIN